MNAGETTINMQVVKTVTSSLTETVLQTEQIQIQCAIGPKSTNMRLCFA